MARKVIWSYEAIADLEALAEYIAKGSTFYAAAFVQKVLDRASSLNEFSEKGRVVPELRNPSIREVFVKEYRLIYSIEKSSIVVLGLIHGKRNLKALLEHGQEED
ncbi:MAG: type II toxin-antitoxin system RelE/ParE family toxin [Bacteroidota bacterium]